MYKKTIRRRRAVLVAARRPFADPPHRILQRGPGRRPARDAARLPDRGLADRGRREHGLQAGAQRLRLDRQRARRGSQTRQAAQAARARARPADRLPGRSARVPRTLVARTASTRGSASTTTSPVSAVVVLQSPSLWNSTVIIDQGTPAGVQVNDPVIDGEGLVGKVAQSLGRRRPGDAHQRPRIRRHRAAERRRRGRARCSRRWGTRTASCCSTCRRTPRSNPGEYVVTAGTVSSQDESLYPPGIPIGRVTSGNARSQYASVNVEPLVNLHNLSTVQVLTAVARLAARTHHAPADRALAGPELRIRAARAAARRDAEAAR